MKSIVIWYFTTNPISGKILVLKLWGKLQDSWKCNILSKKWMLKFNFGMQMNIFYDLLDKVFYK